MDLQAADAGSVCHALRVQAALNIHIHLTDVQAPFQPVDERDQRGGFPAPRGGHEIQEQRSLIGKPFPDQLSSPVIFRKNRLVDLNDSDFAHTAFHSFTFLTSASARACTPSPVLAEI